MHPVEQDSDYHIFAVSGLGSGTFRTNIIVNATHIPPGPDHAQGARSREPVVPVGRVGYNLESCVMSICESNSKELRTRWASLGHCAQNV